MSKLVKWLYQISGLLFKFRFKLAKPEELPSLDKSNLPAEALAKAGIPTSIAIIMDGNGRWAQNRGLPRIMGHRMGVEALKKVVRACPDYGIKYLTVYAFSTENWQRPKDEVDFLMSLFGEIIDREIEQLNKEKVRIQFLGRLKELPSLVQEKISKAMELTKNNKRLIFNVMVNYGGRTEMVDAFKKMTNDQLTNDQINEETISNYLYTRGIPDPDLLIRTGSEMRVSNFLLWQIAYTELWVTDTLWPDFGREHLLQAIAAYQERIRRFGRL